MFSRFRIRSRARSFASMFSLARPLAGLRFALVLGALVLGGAGCMASAGDEAAEADERDAQLGELVLPLLEVGQDGTIYRLRDAVFEVTAADGAQHLLDGNIDAGEVATKLAPGLTTLRLRDGWRLERSTDEGATFEAVGALCTLPDPTYLRILPGATERLRVDFLLRDPRGTFAVVFHVAKPNYMLGASLYIEEGTGVFAAYPGRVVELATYFQTFGAERRDEEDGGKSLFYRGHNTVTELFNDELGAFADHAAQQLILGSLQLRVTARPDGSFQMGSTYTGYYAATMTIEPATAYAYDGVDAEGYPRDQEVTASSTFSIQLRDAARSSVSGQIYVQKIDLEPRDVR